MATVGVELRHNDEALGRLFGGAVEVDLELCHGDARYNDEALGRLFGGAVEVDLELCHGDARFWAGLRGIRSSVAFRRPLLPRPGAHLVPLIIG